MVTKVFVRAAFNYDTDKASDESGLACRDPSRTHQNFKDECDINTIVRRFGLTGELPPTFRAPQYGDFEGVFDYQSALNQVMAANEAFMSMPSGIRARFHNNPQNLIEFLSREENRDEALRMGLLRAETPAADVSKGGVIPPSGSAGSSPVGDPAKS